MQTQVIPPTETTTATRIRLEGLVKSFATPTGKVRAVGGVDLDIAKGETLALLGPNGAGKSTLIDMLLGLLPPDTGQVSLFGRPPAQAIHEGAVGAMLQTGGLLRGLRPRARHDDGLAVPRPAHGRRGARAHGHGAVRERRTEKLSGGQTQRARFALALVCNPELLVLDEPTVALDVEARRLRVAHEVSAKRARCV